MPSKAKSATTQVKPARCRPHPKPTLQEYRDWYHREQRIANELRSELTMARATIEAQAYALAYRSPQRHLADDDLPF